MVDRRWGSPLSSSSSSFPSSSFPFPYDHPRWGAAASSSNSDDEDSSVVLVSHLYLATAGARDSGVYTWWDSPLNYNKNTKKSLNFVLVRPRAAASPKEWRRRSPCTSLTVKLCTFYFFFLGMQGWWSNVTFTFREKKHEGFLYDHKSGTFSLLLTVMTSWYEKNRQYFTCYTGEQYLGNRAWRMFLFCPLSGLTRSSVRSGTNFLSLFSSSSSCKTTTCSYGKLGQARPVFLRAAGKYLPVHLLVFCLKNVALHFVPFFLLFFGSDMTPQKKEAKKKRQCPEVTSSLWASPPPPWNSPRVLFPQPHLPASFFSSFSLFSCRRVCLGPSAGRGIAQCSLRKTNNSLVKKEILLKASLREDLFPAARLSFSSFLFSWGQKGRRKSRGKKASSLFWFNNLDLRGGGEKGVCHHIRNKEQSETPQKRFWNNFKRAFEPNKVWKK